MDNENNEKMATKEQMKSINEYMKHFSIDLKRSLDDLNLEARVQSSKGLYEPRISEKYLNEIVFNPKSSSSDEIEKWLLQPQYYSKNIRALSQYLENAVGQYGRAIYELNVEKSFKYMLVPGDSDNSKLINQDKYKNSYNSACDVCRKLNIHYQFPKIDLNVMEKGVGFYLIDEKKESITLLELPTDYCFIVAPWTYGWIFSIDLTFFDKFLGLSKLLPELSNAYDELIRQRRLKKTADELKPYRYYTPSVEKSFCFTFNPNRADKIPPLAGSLGRAIDTLSYRELLKKKSILDSWKIIAMKIPLNKDTNEMIITSEQAAKFLAMTQSQLPDNVSAFVTPFDSTEVSTNQVSTLDSLVNLGNNSIYSSLGVSPNAFGMDNKNQGAILLSLKTNFFFASTHMYSQFANLVNWLIYLKTKTYKWQVNFFGMKLNHKEEVSTAVDVVTRTNFPVEYLMANIGLEPFQINSFINWSNKMDLKSKMKPLASMNTQSNKGDENGNAGRPMRNDSDLTDAGEKSREYKVQ